MSCRGGAIITSSLWCRLAPLFVSAGYALIERLFFGMAPQIVGAVVVLAVVVVAVVVVVVLLVVVVVALVVVLVVGVCVYVYAAASKVSSFFCRPVEGGFLKAIAVWMWPASWSSRSYL